MKFDAFSAGITPGGLRHKQDIRILICHILSEFDTGVTMEDVIESLQTIGMVNYFEASEAFSELLKTKKLCEISKSIYTLSDNGKVIAKEFASSIPRSVKDNSVLALKLHLQKKKLEKENIVSIKKTKDGYITKCTISGGNFNLFSFKIFAPDENCANIIKNNFYKDPSAIYNLMLSALTQQNLEGEHNFF